MFVTTLLYILLVPIVYSFVVFARSERLQRGISTTSLKLILFLLALLLAPAPHFLRMLGLIPHTPASSIVLILYFLVVCIGAFFAMYRKEKLDYKQ